MPELDWIAYIGIVTGLIGATTGVAGAVMGFIAYRDMKERKTRDLRIYLCQTVFDLHAYVDKVPGFLDHVMMSHNEVAVSTGMYDSVALKKWMADWEKDVAALEALKQQLPDIKPFYDDKSAKEVQVLIENANALLGRAAFLQDKYVPELAKDEKTREQFRQSTQSR